MRPVKVSFLSGNRLKLQRLNGRIKVWGKDSELKSMKHLLLAAWILFFGISTIGAEEEIADRCDCPSIQCSPCENQVHVQFVAEKCRDRKTIKMRSCKKPVCAPKDPLPESCQASNFTGASPVPQTQSLKADSATTRPLGPSIGTVFVSIGKSHIHRQGEKLESRVNAKVFVGDVIETDENSKVTILLSNRHTITVVAQSKLELSEFVNAEEKSKTTLNLLYGKVRSLVQKRDPKLGQSPTEYRVRTPTAVAGVRGTEFVTSFDVDRKVTRVDTLHGLVELSNHSGQKTVLIPKGRYASYVIPSGTGNEIADDDISSFVNRGFMTEVKNIGESDLREIQDATDPNQIVAQKAKKNEICQSPSAALNECVWTVQNGQCLRRRCNANGEWAEETRLPASESHNCESTKSVVAPCDY